MEVTCSLGLLLLSNFASDYGLKLSGIGGLYFVKERLEVQNSCPLIGIDFLLVLVKVKDIVIQILTMAT